MKRVPSDIQKKIIALYVLVAFVLLPLASALPLDTTTTETKPCISPDTKPTATRSGRELMQQASSLPSNDRQLFLTEKIRAGNLPAHLTRFQPVQWLEKISGKQSSVTVTLWVSPDYVSVGTTEPVRTPLTPQIAQLVADNYLCLLPTPKVVDKIHDAARFKLEPQMFSPDHYLIESVPVWCLHNAAIDAQLEKSGAVPGELVSGIKKDIVITNRLAEDLQPRRVAIYGWHRNDRTPIQPLSLVHHQDYLDYSHGVRLVADDMLLDGATTSVRAILSDPLYSTLLSDEGPLTTETFQY